MTRFCLSLIIGCFLTFAIPRPLLAQLSEFQRSQLADKIASAANDLDPNLFPKLNPSKKEVLRRIDLAKQFITSRTDANNAKAWMKYLDLDELVESIESEDASSRSIKKQAEDVRYRLVGTAPGLELTVLRNLRDSIAKLIEAARYANHDKAIKSLGKQLESLAERVRELDENPSSDDAALISTFLGLLDSSGQANDVITSLRHTFSRPNVTILVGDSLVKNVVYRNVNQSRAVNDCILGTRIIGTATMNGNVTANLLPSFGAAKLNVMLAGHIVSNNVGYNGPVKLRTVGYGDVSVSRAISINESGVTMEPAYAHATLKTEIKAIEHRLRIVRKIAKKKAAQQKPKADRIAVEKMRSQVGNQFVEQTNEASSMSMPDVFAKFRPVLKRLSLDEPIRLWGSTDKNVFIDTTFRRHDQLATVVSRPPISEPYDVAVQVHESAINNAFTPILGGRTLTESQLNVLMQTEQAEGTDKTSSRRKEDSDQDDNEDDDKEEPFEIRFAQLRPIVFEARDQTVRIGIRGSRFAQGNRELNKAMEITAVYEPAKTQDGVVTLIRKGDVEVSFGRKKLRVSEAGIKRTIQNKFAEVFPKTLLHRPLEIPSTVQAESLRGRVLRPRLVDAKNGWLTIAVR